MAAADPFWWIAPLSEDEAPRPPSPPDGDEKELEPPTNGQRLAMALYCLFRSTPPLALVLDHVDHKNSNHPYEGDFVEGNFEGLMPYLLAALDSWIIDNDRSDCEKQFHKLFRFDTHIKWGCHQCKEHFSNTSWQFIFEVEKRTMHLYLDQFISEIWRICKTCNICTGYDRVGLGRLPQTLVFAEAASPLLQLKIGEVLYQIKAVIPDMFLPIGYCIYLF